MRDPAHACHLWLQLRSGWSIDLGDGGGGAETMPGLPGRTLYRVADTEMPSPSDKPEVGRLREQLQVSPARVEEVLFQMAL